MIENESVFPLYDTKVVEKIIIDVGATQEQYLKAVDYIIDMSKNKGRVFWLGVEDTSLDELVKRKLYSNMFYDYCHDKGAYGCYEIDELFFKKDIPLDLIDKYILGRSFGGETIGYIKMIYGGKLSMESNKILSEQRILNYIQLSSDTRDWLNNFYEQNYSNLSEDVQFVLSNYIDFDDIYNEQF
ncbi:MAG: hypothetical protein PHG82_01245 [Candidatus Gracilibacteria bacterium]|nr:hypothetical protein [Candidatus Gracilibacteria bacterium]